MTLHCPVCPRHSWLTTDGLAHHLERDHSPAVVAQTLAQLVVSVAQALESRAARSPIDCPTGKVRYADEHEARTELIGTVIGRNRGKQQRRECRVYECSACNGWHLTSLQTRPAATVAP